jgi:formate-dependent nitrite reductase membrane component NrfD
MTEPARSYHGLPVIKEPVWSWEIPLYFHTGGVAGASAGLAYLSRLRGNDVLARRAWAASIAGLVVSPALLISDLGRPARFLNMLRMFKVTSPMSVGSWILSGCGAAASLAGVNAWTGLFPRTARVAGPTAALLGLPLSTYTAALLADTSVPVWRESRRLLPFVFGTGAALGAGAIGVIVTPIDDAGPARRLAVAAAAVEGPLMEVMMRRVGNHGEVYRSGVPATLAHISRAGILAGGALVWARGRRSRAAARIGGALLTVGAVATRWAVFRAGFASAADPKYTVGPQRTAIEQGKRTGAARRRSRVALPDRSLGSPATTGANP